MAANNISTDLIAIAADESRRQQNKARPLVDRGVTRDGCIQIIEAEGLDIPQKSSCYFCPFQQDRQWMELWQQHPDLYERAMMMEELAKHKHDGHYRSTLDPSGRVTLRERRCRYEQQLSLLSDSE
jgi:hypothetical protein